MTDFTAPSGWCSISVLFTLEEKHVHFLTVCVSLVIKLRRVSMSVSKDGGKKVGHRIHSSERKLISTGFSSQPVMVIRTYYFTV